MSKLPVAFLADVQQFIPEHRFFTDPLRTLAYGTDASFYRLIPQLVVRVESETEVIRILKLAQQYSVAITFRAAGTSLSGQAVTDSVLLVLGDHWNQHRISDQGEKIRLQPGVIGAQANSWLLPYGRKIGPDPASINAAKIGGIVANNSSGMCCGTAQNTYSTLAAIRIVLADGTILDTEEPDSVAAFRRNKKELLQGLSDLAQSVRNNTELSHKIRHKYRLKNTTGLSINALVDYTDPIDILSHLMVGSEGILGFVSAVTYHTVPHHPCRSSALIVFATVEQCCQAVVTLKQLPVSAVELLDRRSLASVQNKPGLPEWVKGLPQEACALLIETNAEDLSILQQYNAQVMQALEAYTVIQKVDFSTDPKVNDQLWAIRKGTFPAVGAVRENGTTVIIEDVTFPIEQLAQGVHRLLALFEKYAYHEAIIFGHALDGNLHFVFTQSFSDPEQVKRYKDFMHDVTQLVAVEFGGSLKAEHGTGRNMAPFVALEWGEEAYQMMWQIKHLLDPQGILNPDVILSRDSQLHLKNLKPMPEADPIVDKCIECGFCEPVCPSHQLSLSPRQRIVIWREIQARKKALLPTEALEKEYAYLGVDSCAATGLCAERCPVSINTGSLMKQLRSQSPNADRSRAQWTAKYFGSVVKLGRLGVRMSGWARAIGMQEVVEKGIQWTLPQKRPKYAQSWAGRPPVESMPTRPPVQQQPLAQGAVQGNSVIYFSSCAARTLGTYQDQSTSLEQETISLLQKAGYHVLQKDWGEFCCGQPFESKGFFPQAQQKKDELLEALWQLSKQGEYPIYMDTSPCALQLNALPVQYRGLKIYDSVDFIHRHVLSRLQITPLAEPIALHITCSTQRAGQAQQLKEIVQHCTQQVCIPENVSCCGFAGDKGFSMPELNQHALRSLADAVKGCKEGVSTSRTCEIGLSQQAQIPYHHVVYLLNRVSTMRT